MLALTAFNYTDKTINQYGVVGGGGGSMSPGESGGVYSGGASIPKDIPWDLLEFKVRWTAWGCMQRVTNSYGEAREVPRYVYKAKVVKLSEPLPAEPDYLALHFYPDERIDAVIADRMPDPRIEVKVSEQKPYPPCEEKKT